MKTEYVIEIYNDRWVTLHDYRGECVFTNKKEALKEFNEYNRSYACQFRLIKVTRDVIRP